MIFFSFTSYGETLPEVIQQAIRYNPEVLVNIAQRHTTNEQLKQAEADYYPTINVTAGQGEEDYASPVTVDLAGIDTSRFLNRTDSSVELTQHIFTGFRTTNEVRRNRANTKSVAFKLEGVSNDTALNATEQYLNVLRQQKLIVLAQNNLRTHQRVFKMIKKRVKAGISRRADLSQAEARVAGAETSLTTAESNLEDATIRFVRIVGHPPQDLTLPRTPSMPWIPPNLQDIVFQALKNHPLLKSSWADVLSARAQHYSSRSTNYPQVDVVLTTSHGRNQFGLVGPVNDELAMLRLSYNLYKGGAEIAKQKESAFKIIESLENRNKTINQVVENARLSWNALQAANERMIYIKSHIKSAFYTVKAYESQFKLGQRNLLDVLNAQNEYYQARYDFDNAQFDALFARYRILNSMGSLLRFTHTALPCEADGCLQEAPLREARFLRPEPEEIDESDQSSN